MIPQQTKEFYNIQSRNRKSLSNALLMYFILIEGGSISFGRTKDCKTTLKVLSGNKILIKGNEYHFDSFPFYSQIMHSICRSVVNNPTNHKANSIIISNKDLSLVDLKETKVERIDYRNKIEECRAKEAHFSNTMAYILLTLGYSLTFSNKHLKKSNDSN